jgi:hypothetical protein
VRLGAECRIEKRSGSADISSVFLPPLLVV